MAGGRRSDAPDDLDRLYQAPLDEFTALRNDLAKRPGADRALVGKLQKPSLPAWAVNQLYWRRRDCWDRLVGAAGRLRAAHGKRLSGRGGDVEAAEAEHRGAVRAAAQEIRDLLREAGEVTSAATLSAVIETLQALPGSEPPGRLTRPLRPMGLEALAGLVPAGRVPGRKITFAAVPVAARAVKRAAEARRRAAAALDREIRLARTAERRAAADLSRAREALARAEREREHVTERLQFLERQVTQAARDIQKQEASAAETAEARSALESRRRSLDPPTGA